MPGQGQVGSTGFRDWLPGTKRTRSARKPTSVPVVPDRLSFANWTAPDNTHRPPHSADPDGCEQPLGLPSSSCIHPGTCRGSSAWPKTRIVVYQRKPPRHHPEVSRRTPHLAPHGALSQRSCTRTARSPVLQQAASRVGRYTRIHCADSCRYARQSGEGRGVVVGRDPPNLTG